MENSKKFSCVIIVLILLFCLASCAAEPDSPAYPEYADLAFDASYLSYLGQPSEDVAGELEASGEWEYVYASNKDSSVPSRLHRLELAMIDGEEYECYIRLNGAEAWAVSFERTVTTDDSEEKTAEVRKVYNLLVSELGKPEELANDSSVGTGLEEGLKCSVVGKQVLTEQYTEWWVLDEDVEMASDPELDMVLTCHLKVGYSEDSVTICVDYALFPPSRLYEIARYRESGAALPPY